MCAERHLRPRPGQCGLTLIELIFFIVVVSFGLAGILTVLNVTSSRSADPMVRKQMLALAENVMEEVRMQSFGWCDPDDTNFTTANNAAGCAGVAAEVRAIWDQVTDYNLAVLNTSLAGTAYPLGYTANVRVLPEALGGLAAGEALRIEVTVNAGAETLVLEGYRTRYAPNALP